MPEHSTTQPLLEVDGDYLRALLRDRAAIVVDDNRDDLLISRLAPVARRYGIPTVADVVVELRRGHTGLESAVIEAMTTNETSFFRDRSLFSDLRTHIIPALIPGIEAAGRPLTIWSAASSSGQEIYSVGMLIDEHFPELLQQKRLRLLATDISASMVERCHQGRFSEQELARGLTPAQRDRYFRRDGDEWPIRPDLRDAVLTRRLNLVDSLDPVPPCDLVLIRNVLIYFSKEVRRSVLEKIRTQVLRPDGILVLGATETTINMAVAYDTVELPCGVCHRPRADGVPPWPPAPAT